MGYWTPELELGHPVLDTQHRSLCEFVDEMIVTIKLPNGVQEFPPKLDFLTSHFGTHFEYEEAFMRDVGYDQNDPIKYELHKKEHRDFYYEFSRLKTRIVREGPTRFNVRALAEELALWVTFHILAYDRSLADFVRDSGQL